MYVDILGHTILSQVHNEKFLALKFLVFTGNTYGNCNNLKRLSGNTGKNICWQSIVVKATKLS